MQVNLCENVILNKYLKNEKIRLDIVVIVLFIVGIVEMH